MQITTAGGTPIVNTIDTSRHAIGVRAMPDGLDSGHCHLCSNPVAVVRVCLGGVYTSLCVAHREALIHFLIEPAPAP